MSEIFRKASLSDLTFIQDILNNTLLYMERINLNQWDNIYPSLDILKEDILNEEMYLLEIDNTIVAFVVLNSYQDKDYISGNWRYSGKPVGVIHRLCVDPSLQGNGMGRKVLSASEDELRKLGYGIIRLDVFSQNNHAMRLYEKAGYKNAGNVTFRKGEFYLMEKLI